MIEADSALGMAIHLGEGMALTGEDRQSLQRARRLFEYRDTGLITIRRWIELEDGPFRRRAAAVVETIGEESFRIPELTRELKAAFRMARMDGAAPAAAMEAVNRLCRTIEENASKK